MNVYDKLGNFLNTIYIPYPMRGAVNNLKEYVKDHRLRYPNKSDEGKTRYRLLKIRTRGKGSRETFEHWGVYYVDFNTIGEKYAIAYVYDIDGNGKPCRMDITSIKNLIIY